MLSLQNTKLILGPYMIIYSKLVCFGGCYCSWTTDFLYVKQVLWLPRKWEKCGM